MPHISGVQRTSPHHQRRKQNKAADHGKIPVRFDGIDYKPQKENRAKKPFKIPYGTTHRRVNDTTFA